MLEAEYRRTLVEIAAKYKLEPKLRDIYVEGDSDSAIVRWYAVAAGHKDFSVYKIDLIEVPKTFVEAHGLPNNNRSRVIAVSMFLLDIGAHSAFCICDKDFDGALGVKISNSALVYTDFSSMEMYLYSEEMFIKFFQVHLRRPPEEALVWYKALAAFLSDLFAIRLAAAVNSWSVALPDVWKCCAWTDDCVKFDLSLFLKRLSHKVGGAAGGTIFGEVDKAKVLLKGDNRNFMHGHDLLEALRRVTSKVYKKSKISEEETFKRMLLLMLEVSYCRTFGLFAELDKRLS